MWNAVELDESGHWSELGSFNSIEECKSKSKELSKDMSTVFYFWAAEIPSDKQSQEKIAKDVFEANDGKILRMSIGIEVSKVSNASELTNCSGSCFCVVYTNGTRRCETSYCNSWGYCWWVPCGSSC